ncbi:hypothetical protein Tco_0702681 [Tanacetum coccineum]|uniref:Uncharacterized protein n=1 Tax=Tanacetum coccineum TaxID=301880 RepID=A0ABQ4XWQ6_9ASTR
MTNAQQTNVLPTQVTEDTHVIITAPVNPEGQQQSSSMSSGFVSNMLNPSPDTRIDSIFNLNTELTSLVDIPVTAIAEPPLLSIFLTLALYSAVSSIPGIVDAYLANKMHEAVKTVIQLQSKRLRDEAQAENADFINKLDDNIKKIIKNQVKEQVKAQFSKIFPKIKKTINEQLEAEVLTPLVDAYESDKLIFDPYGDTVLFKRRRDDEDKHEEPSTGSNRGSKRRRAGKELESTSAPKEKTSKTTGKSTEGSKSHHKSAGESAQVEEPMHTTKDLEEPVHQEFKTGFTKDQPKEETSHLPELMDTPLDFSAFVMNRLKINTLTPELLAGPTFELMKGSCKSLVELEYFLEEVYKATTNQLDWINPEGQQYPHDLRKPLPLIPNSQGRQVIPFYHFINNDLEYLSECGVKCQESAHDVYSKRRIIAITKLQIVEWHGYKHLDWIIVRKLTNLNVEERLAFSVSLRMFTRSIVIQRHVKDIQLGVESYQKKLNITKPNTYRSDLKRRDAYTAYSNLKGFIYQNKDKKNKLMRNDELHKFSDGTLDDVWTALNDRLKRIRMEYLPQTIWRQSDRERATAMI